jgi:uncharacterized protein (DUF1810 family)
MSDFYNLQRFVEAQDHVYTQVCSELRQGEKRSHWMWYIFPQIQGLGHSFNARLFAISSLAEAQAYLQHPILGSRLIECTTLVMAVEGRPSENIFGYIDSLKFCSSMTLFAHAAQDNKVFVDAVKKYFDGEYDEQTLKRLR